MKTDNRGTMPPEYEYLNPSLVRAQEHVFLINAELEKLDSNPLNEKRIVKLQDERQAVIGNIKQDFELQTWEDGPARFEEIEKVIDYRFSDDVYQKAKSALLEANNEYGASNYWKDKFEYNIDYYKKLDLEINQIGQLEKQATSDIIRQQEWEYEMYGRITYEREIEDLDIEPEIE